MKTILLIEDNEDVRENTAEILELAHYDVLTAENGKIGVDKAKSEKPDLIVCDIMMPELDGYGVLYLLSKDPETSSIPFIFLTAKAEKSDMRKGMNLGADDYLTKPFDEMELLDAIESRLKRSDTFRADFNNDVEGLNDFFSEAKGLEEMQKLSEDRRVNTFRKKQAIFMEGNHPNYLYFINSGKVKTYKTNKDGKEYITGLYKEGQFLGYMALLQNTAYNETAEALEETEICLIPKQDFFSLLYTNRDVANRFIKMLSGNILEQEERLLNLAYSSVRQRVADALLLLQKKYSDKEEQFSIAVTRDDLASIVGTATESVIRVLSDFKEEEIIGVKGREITIVDLQKLEKMTYW